MPKGLRKSYSVVDTQPASVDRARSSSGSHEISQIVRFVVGTTGGLPDTASSMIPISIGLGDAMRSTSFLRHIRAAAVPAIFGVCSPSAGFAMPLPYSIDFSVTHVQTSSESGAIHRPLTPHPPTSLPGCS